MLRDEFEDVPLPLLKNYVENWWDSWAVNNFDPNPETIPNDVRDLLVYLEEKGQAFNLMSCTWEKDLQRK